MDQELAEPKIQKINTQTHKILEIWKKLPKTDFNKESNPSTKIQLKGKLYTRIMEIYKEHEGKSVSRSTVRRCINQFLNKAK